MSIRPVRLASRIPVETVLPARAAWSMTVLRMNVIGADARNGSTGRTNPAARAPTYAPVRRARSFRSVRQSTSRTAAGAIAQNLMTPAKPRARPAHTSRPGRARWPRRNAALTPSRQNKFIHGSSIRVCAVVMSPG